MSDRDCSPGTLLGAFVLGGLCGAAIAFLTAPRSGRETRERIGDWAGSATERTRERVHHMAQETGDRVRTYGREAGERIREVATTAREKLRRGENEGVDEELPDEI